MTREWIRYYFSLRELLLADPLSLLHVPHSLTHKPCHGKQNKKIHSRLPHFFNMYWEKQRSKSKAAAESIGVGGVKMVSFLSCKCFHLLFTSHPAQVLCP